MGVPLVWVWVVVMSSVIVRGWVAVGDLLGVRGGVGVWVRGWVWVGM